MNDNKQVSGTLNHPTDISIFVISSTHASMNHFQRSPIMMLDSGKLSK